MVRLGHHLGLDCWENILGNTALEERQVIADWVRDALAQAKDTKWSASSREQGYTTFLLALEEDEKYHE
jgi:hypothetical protein